jgi:lipopolysaccharide export system protein LptA
MIGKTASLRQRGRWERGVAMVALGLVLIAAPRPALAQSIGSSFQAYQGSTEEPIDIEADMLEVDDKQKQAVFKGNVVARQGGFSLKARELAVHYTGQPAGEVAAASAGGGDGSITRIEAKGKVLVTTRDDQTATSEWANFDVEKQVVTIGGNVVLSQGENVLQGDRLVIDLRSGKSRFEVGNQSGKQRIRGLFQPKQD